MKTLFGVGAGAAVALLLALQDEPDRRPAGAVASLYAETCAGCHLPPDPRFAVDRAWITQLADTA